MSELVIDQDSAINFIYSDELASMFHVEQLEIKRASHVEPDGNGGWEADLSPIGGPKLTGFRWHQEALVAEAEWISQNVMKK